MGKIKSAGLTNMQCNGWLYFFMVWDNMTFESSINLCCEKYIEIRNVWSSLVSLAASFSVGLPVLPPHKRLLTRALHSIPFVWPITALVQKSRTNSRQIENKMASFDEVFSEVAVGNNVGPWENSEKKLYLWFSRELWQSVGDCDWLYANNWNGMLCSSEQLLVGQVYCVTTLKTAAWETT